MFHSTCSSGDNLPSGLQDWDNASIPQIHCQYVSWWSRVRGPTGLVINATSVLPQGLCQQPSVEPDGSISARLSLHCGMLEGFLPCSKRKPFILKVFWTHWKVQMLFICCVTGENCPFFMFSKLIMEKKYPKTGQGSNFLSAKLFNLCNLIHNPT